MSDRLSRAVEGAIADGQRQGAFDNLPGAGKPLDLGDTSDPHWWIRRKIEREKLDMTGAMPPSLVLRREAASYPEALVTEHREAVVRRIVEDYNQRVIDDRKRAVVGPPPPVAPILDIDEIVAGWATLRAAYEAELKERVAALAAERAATEPAAPGAARAGRPRRDRWWRRSSRGR